MAPSSIATARTMRLFQLPERAKLPISQNTMVGSLSLESAMYLMRLVKAEKIDEITTPASTSTSSFDEPRPMSRPSSSTTATAPRPNANATPWVTHSGAPTSRQRMAPVEAPEATPRMSGETIGLRSSPW